MYGVIFKIYHCVNVKAPNKLIIKSNHDKGFKFALALKTRKSGLPNIEFDSIFGYPKLQSPL